MGWLESQDALEERACVRHLRFADPLLVVMNGKAREGHDLQARLRCGNHFQVVRSAVGSNGVSYRTAKALRGVEPSSTLGEGLLGLA